MQFGGGIHASLDACVVPGDDAVIAFLDCALSKRRELDGFVASQAGVWGTPFGILGEEVTDDVAHEGFTEIPDSEGDAEVFSHRLSVFNSARGKTARLSLVCEAEMHSEEGVASIERARRRDGRINSAGQCCNQSSHRGSREWKGAGEAKMRLTVSIVPV